MSDILSISASAGVSGWGATRRILFIDVVLLYAGPREREEVREPVDFRRFDFLVLESNVVFEANSDAISEVHEFFL